MPKRVFEAAMIFFGGTFALAFCLIVIPALLQSGDILGAFAAGFVNPFSSGYALDAILCGCILISWAMYERSTLGIKHGWVTIPLSFMPGVATAFAVYLILRTRQLAQRKL